MASDVRRCTLLHQRGRLREEFGRVGVVRQKIQIRTVASIDVHAEKIMATQNETVAPQVREFDIEDQWRQERQNTQKRPQTPGFAEYRSPWAISDAASRLCAVVRRAGTGRMPGLFTTSSSHTGGATVSPSWGCPNKHHRRKEVLSWLLYRERAVASDKRFAMACRFALQDVPVGDRYTRHQERPTAQRGKPSRSVFRMRANNFLCGSRCLCGKRTTIRTNSTKG